jgi:hypothetical protein
MDRNIRGSVPEGSTAQHVNSYIMQLNPSAPYATNLVRVCAEGGFDFEAILSIMLVKTKNFAEFSTDTDLFDLGIGGQVQEQIVMAVSRDFDGRQLVDEFGLTPEQLEVYDLVLARVRQVMRLKRTSSAPQPLPTPEPKLPPKPPTPPANQPPDTPATEEPAKSSGLGLSKWWLIIPIIILVIVILGVVAAFIFIPGAQAFIMPLIVNLLPTLFGAIFK